MPLTPGTSLGPYDIVAAIGAGGMGEVYRALDTKLHRVVALKVLPDAFAADSDRLVRFRREAQVLASLNHPNIAHLYGFEDAGSTHALVMELVDGPTLADRITQGPIPLAEALPIARQIAVALEAAHEQGIVHRDLKPANVKVKDDGAVKVLDFGLAKALGPEGASASAEVMDSPTQTARGTQLGMILGTAAYMAPEQARGKVVDKRADIWSFGVVLYEMLTGQRAFKGEEISDVLAAVLRQDLDWTALPAGTPPRLTRLLERCLDRDLRARLRDIGEARIEIAKILGGAPDRTADSAPAAAAVRQSAVARVLPWALVAMGWIGLLAALLIWSPWRSVPVPSPRTLAASLGADASLDTGLGSSPGATALLSPDGTMLAFVAQQAGKTRIFLRKLDQLQAAPLAGTEGAAGPLFSPDGKWIAFFADGHLRKVPTTGGAAVSVCDAPAARGGTWTDDNTIIFCPTNGSNTKLVRVSAASGVPAVVGTLGDGATSQRWPQALPRGAGVLYTESSNIGAWDGANLVVAPLSGGAPKIVVRGGYYGRYVPSGHLIYMQHGTLFAVPFDLRRLEAIGQAVPALEGVAANPTIGYAQVSVSTEGTLVYVPGTAADQATLIDWMTRDGKRSVLRATKMTWAQNPRFSSDGQKLTLDIFDGQRNIWVYDWARDTSTQLTFGSLNHFPVWTPDGRRVAFASDRDNGIGNLYWVNADGTGDVTRLTDSQNAERAYSWHPNGKFLAFQANRPGTGWDLMILPIEGDAGRGWAPGTPTVFLSTAAAEQAPMFSPDGRWIAYQSNEAGDRFEVYVRPFPGPGGGEWRVSTDGGTDPRWSASAHELLFLNQGRVMVASYAVTGDSLRMDTPQVWSTTNDQVIGSGYDLHPDGRRLALLSAPDQGLAVRDKVVFVFNFFDYLRKIAPARK